MKQDHKSRVSSDDALINRVVTYLSDPEVAQLDAIAEQLGVTRSWVIRRCLRNHLASETPITAVSEIALKAGRHN